jgi:hypothetical protein
MLLTKPLARCAFDCKHVLMAADSQVAALEAALTNLQVLVYEALSCYEACYAALSARGRTHQPPGLPRCLRPHILVA